ncbi:hypothetical protein E3P81_00975 [Wallemia ichthyophaga]|nr:hypothetical protein E3P97_00976 [Wallemia ichthyophaga]TIB29598.1 hypothetical protein E3P85_03088 [Wallemia ichthyophaga]TIB49050.1 hypothetical protein E3P82_00973 [Wallemia ichthyophaga]TIB52996.1 hypothetical protein E3P81_00975 [Wallemia ichthyophaga]TIB55628.1 hypothetical protein E3P80_00974 [Wallemia ichthyophaga]
MGIQWMNPPNSNTLDEIIPNAVVIKNIPFSLPKDQLLSIIHDLNIPTPYAFNYHYDTSNPSNDPAFRGLAFANFRTSHDASAIVAALNGFDVLGRKLRVEYKKVLHPQDKERIERDKALRRMASLGINNPLPFNPPDSFDDSPTNVFDSVLSDRDSQASPPTMCHAELDLNDPSTLEIYSRILVFKEDRMRDDLAFSKNLTMSQRRIVHLVAQRLSVYHYSIGQGDDRFVIVSRNPPPEPPTPRNDPARSLKHSSSTITRGGRPDLVSNTSFLSPASTGIGMQIPPGLRTKKSMPDMKRLNGSATFNTAPGLTSRASNSNLKEAYSSIRTVPDLQGVSFAPPMLSGRRSATLGPGPPGNGGFASLFAPPHSHSDAAGAGAGTNAARTYSEAGTFHPPPLPFPLDLATHHGSATPSEQSLTTSPAQMSAAQLTSPPVRQPRGPPSTTASQGFSQPPSRGISSPALSPHPSPRLNQQLPIASHLKHPHTSNLNHTHPFTHSLPLNTSSSTSSPHTLTERTNEIMHSNNE